MLLMLPPEFFLQTLLRTNQGDAKYRSVRYADLEPGSDFKVTNIPAKISTNFSAPDVTSITALAVLSSGWCNLFIVDNPSCHLEMILL